MPLTGGSIIKSLNRNSCGSFASNFIRKHSGRVLHQVLKTRLKNFTNRQDKVLRELVSLFSRDACSPGPSPVTYRQLPAIGFSRFLPILPQYWGTKISHPRGSRLDKTAKIHFLLLPLEHHTEDHGSCRTLVMCVEK